MINLQQIGRQGLTAEQRFWKYVDKRGPDECWNWTGAKISGYGVLTINKKAVHATKISCQIHGKEILPGQHILHSCDNPPCCNPAHLRGGTHLENVADKMERGRHKGPRGELCAQHVLVEDQVQKIRTRYATERISQASLAKEFGVIRQTIGLIVIGKNWRYLPWPSEQIRQQCRRKSFRPCRRQLI